jgi:hypothetical protein
VKFADLSSCWAGTKMHSILLPPLTTSYCRDTNRVEQAHGLMQVSCRFLSGYW